MERILCVDFDGVIHSYTSGWKGVDTIADPPVAGAFEWLKEVANTKGWKIAIYSSRSKEDGGIEAMKQWMFKWGLEPETIELFDWPVKKPAAYMTIDDRGFCFEGTFPTLEWMANFKPWYRR